MIIPRYIRQRKLYISRNSFDILYAVYVHQTILYVKSSCFYLSLIQAAGSHVKGNNDLSSESRCLRGCKHVSAVFTDRRHYFQQFYLLPELPFGRGRTQR